MIEKIKKFVVSIKLKYAILWIDENGLSVVRIVERAGTKYIVARNGEFHRIGHQVRQRKVRGSEAVPLK